LFDTGSTLTTGISGVAKKSSRPGPPSRTPVLPSARLSGRRHPVVAPAAEGRDPQEPRGRGVQRRLAGHQVVPGPAVDQGIQGRAGVDVQVHGHQSHVVVAGAAVDVEEDGRS
jgi:hypothetical protein